MTLSTLEVLKEGVPHCTTCCFLHSSGRDCSKNLLRLLRLDTNIYSKYSHERSSRY